MTGPDVQTDRARDDFHARPEMNVCNQADYGRLGSVTGPGVQADRARDDRGLQILSRSRDEKYWGLNFGSLHTPPV